MSALFNLLLVYHLVRHCLVSHNLRDLRHLNLGLLLDVPLTRKLLTRQPRGRHRRFFALFLYRSRARDIFIVGVRVLICALRRLGLH